MKEGNFVESMKKFLEKLLIGDANKKYIKKLQPLVDKINALEPEFEKLSAEQLKGKTQEFKERLAKGETLDDLLPEAFAAVREASKRTLGQRHYDVQLIGGITLHRGEIAEMRTGEGKTLTSTSPIYLNALLGKGVHVVTVNDYLAKRDAEWMGQIYHALGMTVGAIGHFSSFIYSEEGATQTTDETRDEGVEIEKTYLKPCQRAESYAADITYGTNNEFGFDYLRDNMAQTKQQLVQRELHYAIIDEVDSILIDEARTPLIISAPDTESTDEYYQFAKIVKTLVKDQDYNVDEKRRSATLTADGISKVEKSLGVDNLYVQKSIKSIHHLEQALRAEALFKKDKDYVVKDGEVIIVDEFTGRLMTGRRYSQGLHQAIEAKEGVQIQRESKTLATITFQNYFRMYKKLAGMTGTAFTEAEEFRKIYGLEVTVIPTHRPIARVDKVDRIYKSEKGKFKAVVEEIKHLNEQGVPVLVGTASIEKNELLSGMLTREGVKHEMLNAKNHEKEAGIIAQAGRPGSVTIATNMAGRGVDIILGGNPKNEADAEKVKALGGLHVIGTERHESRRIDNQLRGRAGRQGDPGMSQFYVSMEDDLMRVFASDRMRGMMNSLGLPEDQPIENKIVSRSLTEAQKRVETHNYDTRKHVVQYDDVLNKQRQVIYDKRREILIDAENNPEITKTRVLELIQDEIGEVVAIHTSQDDPETWNLEEIWQTMWAMFGLPAEKQLTYEQILARPETEGEEFLSLNGAPKKLAHYLFEEAKQEYDRVEKMLDENVGTEGTFRQVEKELLLRTIDNLWIGHLETMDSLRTSIGLRGYGQRDPLVEYKKESFNLFNGLLREMQKQVVNSIFKVRAKLQAQQSVLDKALQFSAPAKTQSKGAQGGDAEVHLHAGDEKFKNVGRNDACPCGATKEDGTPKKFKHCHGA